MPPRSAQFRTARLQHPLRGVHRGRAYQDQPPFSTPEAINVWPQDGLAKRSRIGQRPGKKIVYPQQLGSGAAGRMLATVGRIISSPPTRIAHTFTSTLTPSLFDTKVGGGSATSTYDATNGGLSGADALRAVLDIDTTKPYTLDLDFLRPLTNPPLSGANGFRVRVYFRFTNTSPTLADGTYVELYIGNEAGVTTLDVYENNTLVATDGFTLPSYTGGTLRVSVNDNNVAKAIAISLDGITRLTHTLTNANSDTKQRFGFYASRGAFGPPDNRAVVTELRAVYTSLTPAASASFSVVCASAAGKLYADNPSGLVIAGKLTEITQTTTSTTPLTLSSTNRLMATDMLQKLYIADHDTDRYIGSGLTISNTGAVTGGPDWTQRGISVKDDVAIVTSPTGSAVAGVYALTSISAGTLQLTGYTAAGSGTATIRVLRAIKVYDPAIATNPLSILTPEANGGLVPHGCSIVCLYSNSLVWSGDKQAPHVIYMSARDNPRNYNYAATGKSRAFATLSSGSSVITRPITALVPFWADYLIVATAHSMHLFRGDPRLDGQLDKITDECGILDRFAWCLTPEGDLLFLAADGIRHIAAGAQSGITPVTLENLPDELVGIDPVTTEISMVFDVERRGALLALTPKDGSVGTHWWIDWDNKGPWITRFPAAAQPRLQCVNRSDDPAYRGVLQIDGDGYVRAFRDDQYVDDVPALATADKRIVSSIKYGPFGSAGRDGSMRMKLHTVSAQLAAGSQAIGFRVYRGSDAEQAARSTTVFKSGTFAAAPTPTSAKRTPEKLIEAAGGAFVLELFGSDTSGTGTWSIDGIDARLGVAGRNLVL